MIDTNNKSRLHHFLLILGIIFIAFNLRPSITSVGPVIDSIRGEFGISNGIAGLITTLPLLGFATFSLIAPILGKRWGNELTLFIGLLILFIGISIRSGGSLTLLFVGTGLIGIGITIGNVLLPAIVKEYYPLKVGILTSIYSASMNLFAALASGLSIPFAEGLDLGWKKGLLMWGIVAILGAVIWFPQVIIARRKPSSQLAGLSFTSLLRSPIAWQVTVFLGLQSILFFGPVTWLPDILVDRGLTVATAGWMLGFMQFSSLPANLITPVLAGKMKTQRPIIIVIGLLYFISLTGLLIGGSTILIGFYVVLLGLAQGAAISLALTLFSLRSRDSIQAAQLSGMAQSIGYLITSIGPILMGYLFDVTNSWTYPILFLLLVSIGKTIAGLGAGRNVYVGERAKT